jgi:putative ABC transport system permease protein
MTNLSMAIRNLGRNKRRTFLAALSVFIAILLVVALDGFAAGFIDSMTRNYTKNTTGHVNITTDEYRARERFMPTTAAIKDASTVIAAIKSAPALEGRIREITPRVRFGVVLSSGATTKAAIGIGGDPETERRLLMLDKVLLPGGSYCNAPGTAIIGEKLAQDLSLSVGDYLKVIGQKADYGMGFKKFRISGVFRTGVENFDRSTFQVGLDDARDLLGLGSGASQILVMLKDSKDSDRAARLIAARLQEEGYAGLSVQSWTSLGDVARIITYASSIYSWIELIVAFLGSFIIANVMMMVVLERRREIGILKAMGMRPKTILGIFLAEGTMLGIIGAGAGAIGGTALNVYLHYHGLDMSGPTRGMDFPIDSIVYSGVNLIRALLFFGMGTLVSAVVAFLPARDAARMEAIDAIRSA